MKFVTACFVFLCLFVTACERQRTTQAAGEYDLTSDRDRDLYEDRVEARLKEFEHRFHGLEARLKGLDRIAHERLRVDVDELRARKAALEQKLNDLRRVSDQSWLDLKASIDREVDQLEAAYNLVSANNQP